MTNFRIMPTQQAFYYYGYYFFFFGEKPARCCPC